MSMLRPNIYRCGKMKKKVKIDEDYTQLPLQEKIWLAGVVDSRGCFDRHSVVKNKEYIQFRFKLQGDKEFLDIVKNMVEFGAISENPPVLWLSGFKLIKLLSEIKEYTLVRTDEIESFLEDWYDYQSD